MRLIFFLSVCLLFSENPAFSQRVCVVNEASDQRVMTVSENLATIPQQEVIIIPVVVHIVYNTPAQNISDNQVRSQIAVLNEDFRKRNRDTANIPGAFKSLAADSRIEFRLATIDPAGFSTNGIVRKSTMVGSFGLDDMIKSSVSGGDDSWNRDEYLNLWVGNLVPGIMGYASTPGCAAEKDGVVISYQVFGTTGHLKAPYNKGRTAVHEIGHWLGLRHIWGDASCGDDKIADTPPQQGPTRGCPSGVVATCASGSAGNMYMNFMDFTNDACTSMFTIGQAARMRELFAQGEARFALLASGKAHGAVEEIPEILTGPDEELKLFPNPVIDELSIRIAEGGKPDGRTLVIYNHLGQQVKRVAANSGTTMRINVKEFKSGLYYISTGKGKTKKFIKTGSRL